MIKGTGQNRGKERPAGSGDSVSFFWFFALLGCFLLSHQSLLSQPSDSLSADTSLLTAAQKKNHTVVVSLKWRYKGRNVNGIALHGFSDYYGQNTAGYRINGIELSLGGGAKTLNGIALGFGTLSTYGAVNGIIVHSLFTSVGHLRGASGPAVFAEYDTLDGIALFSFFALHYQFQGVSVAGFWQTGGIGNGISVSGIGHQYDDAFRGAAACGVVGIYDGLFRGITVSGIGNKFSGNASGLAFSGIYNYASQGFSGVSVSLLRNKSGGQFNGLQTGMFCRAEKLAGVQVGLINRSNRISGVQLGLVNIIISNPKGRRVLPFVNWNFSPMKDTVISPQKDSILHYLIYGDDGFLKHEYFLKNGQMHGAERYYLTRAKIEKEIIWKNGKKHGWEYDHLDPERTALFWENDSLIILRHKIEIPIRDELLSGDWFLDEYKNGRRDVFLIRDFYRDTINHIVNDVRIGWHFLGLAGSTRVYGWFDNGHFSGVYAESPSGKKNYGTISETDQSNYMVNIIIREKNLFDYDNYSSSVVLGVISPFFPKTCRISISVHNTSGSLLYAECVIKNDSGLIHPDTSCLYFNTEKHDRGHKAYYWNNDSVTGYYRNGRLAYRQILSTEKINDGIRSSSRFFTKSLTVYYKNKRCAVYQTKDTLLIYSKRGKPVQIQLGDSITLYRRDGSDFLFYCPEYRKYTARNGKIIAERFGDSLVKYDDAGKLIYHARFENDSVWVYQSGDTNTFISGHLFSAGEIFDITEFKEIQGEADMVFLLLHNEEVESWIGTHSMRFYWVKEFLFRYFDWPSATFNPRE